MELFGSTYESKPSAGLFGGAATGTLFLKDVDELPRDAQSRLLRLLDARNGSWSRASTVYRDAGGEDSEGRVPPRVIASTHVPLAKGTCSGLFDAKLARRLQSFTIMVPALRERRPDIPLLVSHFLETFCNRRCRCIGGVSDAAMQALTRAEWPENIRELRAAVEYAVSTGKSGFIRLQDLPPSFHGGLSLEDDSEDRLPTLADAEARLIRVTLNHFDGNKAKAARSLGISRHKLYNHLKALEFASGVAEISQESSISPQRS
jgi:two-component system, NtrC family, response regulator HydG